MDIQVFCLDNSEFAEFNAVSRGWRGDIYVKISANYYKLEIYDMVRLQQDFELELEEYGVFSPKLNLIIVEEVNNVKIKESIQHLADSRYFDEIKSLEPETLAGLGLLSL